jgi:molybdate transport system permease protein
MSEAGFDCSLAPLALSLKVAAAMLCCHLFAGVGLAWLLSRPRLRFRPLWEGLISLPLVFPPIAIGFFLLLLLGRRGVVGSALHDSFGIDIVFSPLGVYLAAFLAGLPLIVKPVQAAIENSASELAEAATVLGRGRLATFFLIVVPNVRSAIVAGLALAIGRALGEVGITLMLGGNIVGQTNTLSLAIYNSVLDGDFDCATHLSLLLGAGSMGFFMLMRAGDQPRYRRA